MIRGIDIFNGSGEADFEAAKAAGLQFCIARCGYGQDMESQDDGQFQRNYDQCKALGIPLGSYFYTYATTVDGAESEKAHLKRLLSGKSLELPVFIDMEDADGYKARNGGVPDQQTNTDIIKALCEYVKSLGFKPGFYVNKDWSENHVCMDQLSEYAFYYARPGQDQPDKPCYLWQDQIGSTGGHFPGVKDDSPGTCDTDMLMNELPEKKPAVPPEPPASVAFTYPETYTVQSGDTLSGIASKFGTTYQKLAALNGIANPNIIYVGQVIQLSESAPESPSTSEQTYTVQPGDTLSGIASQFGTTYQRLAEINGISDPNIIHIGQGIKLTDSGSSAVRQIQQRLNDLHIASLSTDGISGPCTIAAVKSFQSLCKLTPDGIWGTATESAYQMISDKPEIRQGATGNAVRYVQFRVGSNVDGIFGPNTNAAVMAFQRTHGLTADGIVGPHTWAALIGG